MNPQWNTPPNGDFASYVERLSAQAALPRRAPHEGDHGLDVGMNPTPGAPGAQGAAAVQRRAASNEDTPSQTGPFTPAVLKAVAVGGALVFLVLWSAGVPIVVLAVLLGAALWLASKLKGLKLSPGVAKWQQVLEEAARKQKEQQRKQGHQK